MPENIVLFPSTHRPSGSFMNAANIPGAVTFKSFSRNELVRLAQMTQIPRSIGLITDCVYYQHITGVTVQGLHSSNRADVKFSFLKEMMDKDYVRYMGAVFLLNSKIVFETVNAENALNQLEEGLKEACYEHRILYDLPPAPSRDFVRG